MYTVTCAWPPACDLASERNLHLYLLYSDSSLTVGESSIPCFNRSRSFWRSFCFKYCQQCYQCRPPKYLTRVSDYDLRRPSRSVRIFFSFSDSHSRKGVCSVPSSLPFCFHNPILDMTCLQKIQIRWYSHYVYLCRFFLLGSIVAQHFLQIYRFVPNPVQPFPPPSR